MLVKKDFNNRTILLWFLNVVKDKLVVKVVSLGMYQCPQHRFLVTGGSNIGCSDVTMRDDICA